MGDKAEDAILGKDRSCVKESAFEKKILDDIRPRLKEIPGFQGTELQKLSQVFVVHILAPVSEENRQQIQQILDEYIPLSPYTGRIEEDDIPAES